MPMVLAVLCSGRKKGYTAGLLDAAAKGAEGVTGVTIDRVNLHDHQFGPCKSCFACIRDPNHLCVQPDDFGRKGEGVLYRKLKAANGIIIADPVHGWGCSAMCHLFVERWYPFVWSGGLGGMPFMSISCATNQGMQHVATQAICRWAFTHGLKYIGQLAVHASWYGEAMAEAEALGREVGEAAIVEAQNGRKPFANDEERFLAYMNKPWNPLENYLANLSNGTFTWEKSLIERALRHGTFKRPEALDLLRKAREGFREAIRFYNLKNYEKATKHLVESSAFWTHATWKEFLEEQAIKAAPPKVYRPMPVSQ